VLQCVVVCCSVLQCVAVCCSALQCVSVCCGMLKCLAQFCNTLIFSIVRVLMVCFILYPRHTHECIIDIWLNFRVFFCVAVYCSVSQCVAVCCSVLKCVAVRCNILKCVAACCNALQGVNAHIRKYFLHCIVRDSLVNCNCWPMFRRHLI